MSAWRAFCASAPRDDVSRTSKPMGKTIASRSGGSGFESRVCIQVSGRASRYPLKHRQSAIGNCKSLSRTVAEQPGPSSDKPGQFSITEIGRVASRRRRVILGFRLRDLVVGVAQERYRRNVPRTLARVEVQPAPGRRPRERIPITAIILWRSDSIALEIASEIYRTTLQLSQPECQIIWPIVI